MNNRLRFTVAILLVTPLLGCTLLFCELPADPKVSTYGFSFTRTRPAPGDVRFSVALPRDGYLDVKWAYTYLSFDAVPSSPAVSVDSQGNGRFEFSVTANDFTRIDHLFYSETVEGVVPLFSYHEQEFPASFPASFDQYSVSNAAIPADHPLIRAIASRLRRDSMIETIARVVAFFDTLDYDNELYGSAPAAGGIEAPYAGEDSLFRETLTVLDDLAGVCYEKARLGAAILRACGIPTRIVLTSGHGWDEVYLPADGWVPLDFSSPDRHKAFTFPIQPWRWDNYANMTAIGGEDEPPHLLDWDTTLWGRLAYYGGGLVSGPGDWVTDVLQDLERFFDELCFIVVTPIVEPETSLHPFQFFDSNTTAFVFDRGAAVVLELNGDTEIVLDFAAPMILDLAGVPTTFRFTHAGEYVVIERM